MLAQLGNPEPNNIILELSDEYYLDATREWTFSQQAMQVVDDQVVVDTAATSPCTSPSPHRPRTCRPCASSATGTKRPWSSRMPRRWSPASAVGMPFADQAVHEALELFGQVLEDDAVRFHGLKVPRRHGCECIPDAGDRDVRQLRLDSSWVT